MTDLSYGAPREHEWKGGLYVIRDVWKDASNSRFVGKALRPWERWSFVTCEYAVQGADGIEWRPCAEGVMYDDIEPLRRVDG